MSRENRRRTGFFAAIVADPWRKGLAIALATLLWFFIDSRITRTIERTVPLKTVGTQTERGIAQDSLSIALPTDQVLGMGFRDGDNPIDRVKVVVSGPRFRVDALEKERLDLLITAIDWENRSSIEFNAGDVRRDQQRLEGLDIQLVPPRITLDVKRIAHRSIPLTLDNVEVVDTQFVGRLRRETSEFAPREAIVLGTASGIDQLTRRPGKPFRATLQGDAGGGSGQVTFELAIVDGPELELRFQTQPVLTMQVKPQTAGFELELPIVVDDLALPPELRGTYQPDSRTRTVRIAAGGELRSKLVTLGEGGEKARLREWAFANLRLLVYIEQPENGSPLPPVLENRPARLRLVGRLYETVDRSEYLLEETVVVTLRRQT